jgi:hypothetical protein
MFSKPGSFLYVSTEFPILFQVHYFRTSVSYGLFFQYYTYTMRICEINTKNDHY